MRLEPQTTVIFIGCVSAHDLISRRAVLTGLKHVDGGSASLPFVHMFKFPLQKLVGGRFWCHALNHTRERETRRCRDIPFVFEALQVAPWGWGMASSSLHFLDDIHIATHSSRPCWPCLRHGARRVEARGRSAFMWGGQKSGTGPTSPCLEGSNSASGNARHEDFGHPDRPPRISSQILALLSHGHRTLLSRIPLKPSPLSPPSP